MAHTHFQLSTFRSGLVRTITEKREYCIGGLPSISRPRKPLEVHAPYDLYINIPGILISGQTTTTTMARRRTEDTVIPMSILIDKRLGNWA